MKRIFTLLLAAALPLAALAQSARPHILGLSHIALYVHDLGKSRAFYTDFLGFAEPYSLTNSDGSVRLTWIKINDEQTIELFPEKEAGSDRLYHIAIETDDAAAMRNYLSMHGITVPDQFGKGKIGNWNFTVTDPNGRLVEITQYAPDGWTALNKGKFMPATRISTHMAHVGILTGDLAAAQNFYEGLLGFKEIWRGSKTTNELNWVHVQVPEGKDFIELMLYSELPAPDKRGSAHHLCLEVPDLDEAKAILAERAERIGYTKPMNIQTGVNRKRQLNLWDPDGTRVELMEPNPVGGIPAPPSTAPPPHPADVSK